MSRDIRQTEIHAFKYACIQNEIIPSGREIRRDFQTGLCNFCVMEIMLVLYYCKIEDQMTKRVCVRASETCKLKISVKTCL